MPVAHAGARMVLAVPSLLRAAPLLLALSSSMAAAAGSSAARSESSLLKGQNLRRIRLPRTDVGEAVVRPVRPAGDHTLLCCCDRARDGQLSCLPQTTTTADRMMLL